MKNHTAIICYLFTCLLLASKPSLAQESHTGFTQVSGTSHNNNLTLKVWYPTEATPEDISLGYFKMHVARKTETKSGRHGLVIISHGDGGSDLGHRNLGLFLSKHGYIVASFMHPHNNYIHNGYSRKIENWIHRPKHIKAALDIIKNSRFNSYIDKNKVSIIGFSAGGYTAITAIGGKADVSNIAKHCKKNGQHDAEFCRPGISSTSNKDTEWSAAKSLIQEKDERIKAAVLLAPIGVLFYGQNMLSDINMPVLVIGAEKDTVLPRKFHAEYVAKNIKGANYEVMPGAGHYSFITPFPKQLKGRVHGADTDPKGFNRQAFQNKLETRILQFLNAL